MLETVARTTRTTRATRAKRARTDDGANAARSRDAACPKRHKMEAEAMFPGVDVGDMLVVPTRQVRGTNDDARDDDDDARDDDD